MKKRVGMNKRIPLYREDDNKLLGYIVQDGTGWRAETVFGYLIDRALDRAGAEAVLEEKGSDYLKGVWQYFDKDDQQWYPCVIKQAYEQQVTVIRTNAMGYQESDEYKMMVINDADETKLVKG